MSDAAVKVMCLVSDDAWGFYRCLVLGSLLLSLERLGVFKILAEQIGVVLPPVAAPLWRGAGSFDADIGRQLRWTACMLNYVISASSTGCGATYRSESSGGRCATPRRSQGGLAPQVLKACVYWLPAGGCRALHRCLSRGLPLLPAVWPPGASEYHCRVAATTRALLLLQTYQPGP